MSSEPESAFVQSYILYYNSRALQLSITTDTCVVIKSVAVVPSTTVPGTTGMNRFSHVLKFLNSKILYISISFITFKYDHRR